MKKIALALLVVPMLLVSCKTKDVDPALSVSTGVVEAESGDGSYDVSVTSNVSWSASTDSGDWISISPASGADNGSIKINVKANTEFSPREGTVTVRGGEIEKTIKVSQDGVSLDQVLAGTRWELSENKSDSGYDDLIGIVLVFNADKSGNLVIERDLGEGIGYLGTMDADWATNGSIIVLNTELGGNPIPLLLTVKDGNASKLDANMQIPLILPSEGLNVVFTKL